MKCGLDGFNLKNAEIVILGTFPGELSLCAKAYYSDTRNQFWRLLGLEYHDFNGLKKLNIGLWDVIESCERNGSLDKNIKNEKYNDMSLLKDKRIFFNGKKAYKYFLKAIQEQHIDLIVSEKHILPSSSPALPVSFEVKSQQWNNILKRK